MKASLLSLSILLLTITSCKKTDSNNCGNINNATLFSNGPVSIGETIHLGTQEVGGYRTYVWHGPNNYSGYDPDITISSAKLADEGWYHLDLTSMDADCQKIDSIYIDVKLLQGTPSCTISNNSTIFNNLGSNSYTTITKRIDPVFDTKALQADGNFTSNLKVYFHTRWRDVEPEDGIYITDSSPLFDLTDNNFNKVYITTTKSSIYWGSRPGQNVYINHINGKLQVRFCDLIMSGNNGSSYTTSASGNIIEN